MDVRIITISREFGSGGRTIAHRVAERLGYAYYDQELILKVAKESGLDGIVCSPLEAGKIHATCGAGFLTVTPGVRFAGGSADDQVRITTPAKAKEIGSDYIVVGRPITQAEDPLAAWRKCVREFVD